MTSTLNRSDTMLGVCEALGRGLGFDPLWLRLAFAGGLFRNPVAMIAGYLALAVVIAVACWLTPARASEPALATAQGANDDAPAPERLAA